MNVRTLRIQVRLGPNVDDFVGGAVNDDEAFELYQKARQVMKYAGFNLRNGTQTPTHCEPRLMMS